MKLADAVKWTLVNIPWDDYGDGDSFVKRGLNKPGTLIKTHLGTFLIGNINELRGICDDCTEFPISTYVIEYAVLVDFDS